LATGSIAVSGEAVSSDDGFAVDFVSSVFEADFVRERWAASALASASEARLAAASRLSESFLAARSDAAAFCDRRLSAAAEASSERRCAADCACARSLPVRSLAVSAAVLLSTSAAKLSFPGDGSDLADFCGGAP
jgi:hypothetical protein